MKQPINNVISYLEDNGPFEGTISYGERTIERIHPGDARLVVITRWLLHRDGNTCPEGTDILTKRKTEYGQNILYVAFRKPNTTVEDDWTIYRITLIPPKE